MLRAPGQHSGMTPCGRPGCSSEAHACAGWLGLFELMLLWVTHVGFSTAGVTGPKHWGTRVEELLCFIRRARPAGGQEGRARTVLPGMESVL